MDEQINKHVYVCGAGVAREIYPRWQVNLPTGLSALIYHFSICQSPFTPNAVGDQHHWHHCHWYHQCRYHQHRRDACIHGMYDPNQPRNKQTNE